MFSIGVFIGKQITFSVAEELIIKAISLKIPLSGTQQIAAYSLSSIIQRQIQGLLQHQPEEQEITQPLYTVDLEKDSTTDHFVLVFNTENVLQQKCLSLPNHVIEHIAKHKTEKIICVFQEQEKKTQRHVIGRTLYKSISNMITKDIAPITGSILGGHAAISVLSMIATTPSLIGLPIYYVCELGALYVGSYLGKQGGRVLLGDYLIGPILKQGAGYLFAQPTQLQPASADIELSHAPVFTPAYSNAVSMTPHYIKPTLIDSYFEEPDCQPGSRSPSVASS